MFHDLGLSIIVCGKIRQGDRRIVTVQDGEPAGKRIVIVDDLVQSGGTLLECGTALLERGAAEVNAYATHAVFPGSSWKKFKQPNIFNKFWVTNSIPTTARELPSGDTFEVLDLCDKIVQDLDFS
jgi:phosphoribosylpyrophosphate synthetase